MAKFRQLHASSSNINWQHGLVLPDIALAMNDVDYGPSEDWKPEDVSTAMIPHGEQMHALQVSKEPYMYNTSTGQPSWIWSLKVHNGDDLKDPEQWSYLNQVYEPLPGDKHEWDWNGSLTGGQEIHKSKEDENANSDGTDGGLWGYHQTREGAMKAAENAWNKYVGNTSDTLGGYDINDIMDKFNRGEL